MQDRLQELLGMQSPETPARNYNNAEMIEVPINTETLDVPPELADFNTQVEKLKLDIVQLRSNIETLNSGYRSILVSTDTKKHEEIVGPLENQIENSLHSIAEHLKKLNAENQTATVHNRLRANVHALLTKQFMDVLLQFRHIQSDYREKVQARIRQRLQIVKPDATPQEIQEAVDSGHLNVFSKQIQDNGQAVEVLAYVEGRHKEVLQIENRVNELHQLFNDMAALVNTQGEYIDNIEANVAASSDFVIAANKDLVGALKRKNRNRKCALICCCISTISIIVAILIIVLVGNSNGWFKKTGM